jgi:hypothetical protein
MPYLLVMKFHADIAILDRQNVPVAVIEVKNKLGTTPDWAAAMRRNLAAHGSLPEARFFLLATPDRFYFWVNKTTNLQPTLPDFSFEPRSALNPYYEQAGIGPTDLAATSFELVIASWLSELAHGASEGRVPPEAARWLKESGFVDTIRSGRLVQQ